MSSADRVSQFVRRARRVQAHSLAQDPDRLQELCGLKIAGEIGLDGTIKMRRMLPDEEVFESLTARVRPFTLPSEPIYHGGVLDELRVALAVGEVDTGSELAQRLAPLHSAWGEVDLLGSAR